MNIEMLDIYDCVSDSIKYTSNKGYREEQIQRRKACERNVLASLKAMFPDNAEYFDIKNFKNNAGDADFGVTYKGEQLLRVGTETTSIYTHPYKVEYEFGGLYQDDIRKHYGIKNVEFMSLDDMVHNIEEYKHIVHRRELISEILKKEEELASLKKELHEENKFLESKKQTEIKNIILDDKLKKENVKKI